MIRIGLSLLLALIALAVIGFIVLGDSGMTPEEAAEAYAQAGNPSTREDIEKVLGKATFESNVGGNKTAVWMLYRNGINHLDAFVCALSFNSDGKFERLVTSQDHFPGTAAWKMRWVILKSKLGLKQ